MAPQRLRAEPAPEEAVTAARRGAELARANPVGLSMAGIEVAEALLGMREIARPHILAMARHSYDPDSTSGLLLGGEAGRRWAQQSLLAAAANPDRPDLTELSRRLGEVDRSFRERVAVVLGQAMRQAMRRATRKAEVRGRKASAAKLAAVGADWRQRKLTPAVLAAIATTEDELLDDSFEDAADQVESLFRERQARRRRVLLAGLAAWGLTRERIDTLWSASEDQRAANISAYLSSALFSEARARLANRPAVEALFAPQGEVPFDPTIPTGIVTDTVRLANGASPGPGAQVPDPITDDGAAAFDVTDASLEGLIAEVLPGVAVSYMWVVGEPSRPFEPHQDLAGVEFDDASMAEVLGKSADEWPYGLDIWRPGDHIGCQCSWEAIWSEG